ncbi:hypothetical protein V490_03082, partial [Pseudogymnoascus sp. VKM F-3557]
MNALQSHILDSRCPITAPSMATSPLSIDVWSSDRHWQRRLPQSRLIFKRRADLRSKRRSLSKAIASATIPVLQVVAVHLRFEVLIREYYRDCGQMDTGSGQSLESGRQSRLTPDAAPSGLYMVGWGLQSDRLHNMHSPDMIPPFGSRGANRSAKLSAGTQTPLLRPVKLQQRTCGGKSTAWLRSTGKDEVTRSVKTREAKGLADSSESTEQSDRPNLYISSSISAQETRFKDHSLTQCPTLFSMATVNMNCVEFYNPNPALKASHSQLTRSVLNQHLPSLQPSISPPGDAESARNDQDSDSLDDSLPSLDELFQAFRNGDIPEVPHQNHKPLHISMRQLIDKGRLQTNPTITNSAYVPGNTQRKPLIIEDDSDNERDEAEAGVASSDLQPQLLASIEDQDASECGLATQDTASTSSSLFGPSTPRDSDYLSADCFIKDGQQRPSFAELNSTFPVQVRRPSPNCSELAETTGYDQIHQGVEKAIVDEMRPSPLREKASGSCGRGSVCDIEGGPQQTSAEAGGSPPSSAANPQYLCDPSSVCNIEDELRQTSEEAEGSPPPSAPHSQYNQMDQESQNNTDVRGISSEEQLWEKTFELQHCQQKEQEDEDKDDIEATSSED